MGQRFAPVAIRCAAAILALSLAHCQASEAPSPPNGNDPLPPAFATAIIAYDEGNGNQQCADMPPACDAIGTCGPTDILGEPDDVVFELPADGFVELAFLCSSLIERGGGSTPELKIYATVPEGSSALLQVSVDGLAYDELGVVDATALEFDLARLQLTDARFIRLLNQGPEAMAIDALEALRNP